MSGRRKKNIRCSRCGVVTLQYVGPHTSPLCVDCRSVLTLSERNAWTGRPEVAA